jgi:methylornithine synthase
MGNSGFDSLDERTLTILGNAMDGKVPSIEEVLYLSELRSIEANLAIFNTARIIRERNFGKKVFLYGFVYFSTYCRNNCSFCYYRKTSNIPPRYRKSLDEVMDAVGCLEKSGIHLIDLTMGEDPVICEEKAYSPLIDMCKAIKETYKLPIMVSPGVVPQSFLKEVGRLGVDFYALYQETHNRSLYSKLRLGQSYDERVMARVAALKEGILVEDGLLLGVGESQADVVNSIFEMKKLGAQQVRAMGLAPQEGTPLANLSSPPILDEMRTIALMRIVHQDRLIPASYDVDGMKGLELRLIAGANIVTSIIPPEMGLHGVAQSSLNIDNCMRTIQGISPYLNRLGLEPSSRKELCKWIEKEKELLSEANK